MRGLLIHFKYLALFAALIAAGIGVPIPEEVTQLTAGALAHERILDLRLAIPVAWAGVVTGDTLLFVVARRHRDWILGTRAARRLLTPERVAALERRFSRHTFLTIMVARHTSGLRFAAFVLAATHGVRPGTFVLADALSALLSVPLVVGAGYGLWQHLAQAQRDVRIAEIAILASVALIAAMVILLRRRSPRSAK